MTIDIGHFPETSKPRKAPISAHDALVRRVHFSVATSLWVVAATTFFALSWFVKVGEDVIIRNVEYAFPWKIVSGLETLLVIISTLCYFGMLFHRAPKAEVDKSLTGRLSLFRRSWYWPAFALSVLPPMLVVLFFPAREDWPTWLSSEIRGLVFAVCILLLIVGLLFLSIMQLMRLNKVLLEDLEGRST